MKPAFSSAQQANALIGINSSTAIFDAAGNKYSVGLFINDITPNVESAFADFDAATFTGYAAQVLVVNSYGIDAANRQGIIANNLTPFQCTAEPGAPQSVYGWYAFTNPGNVLIMAKRFDTPLPIHDNTLILPTVALVLGPDLCFDDWTELP